MEGSQRMARRRNHFVWAGFLIVVVALLSYLPLFVRFPLTRDFPWVNLLFFVVGASFLGVGVRRAYRQPELYRGKVSGAIFSALSALALGLFLYGIFYHARDLPASKGAPQVGEKAPEFTLPDQNGSPVTLSRLLASAADSPARAAPAIQGAVLIFYRGYW